MQEKLVSIIMPVHNSEKYIKQALESVKKQIYQNYEIIIIDDNSKDKTLEIIQKAYINKEKIKIIRLKRHRGVAIAINVGIRNASGRYIADGQNEVLAYYRKSPKSRSANKFNTAHYRWKLYKEHEGLSGTYLSFCFYGYMINGILKRIKKYTNFRYE